MSDPLTTVLIPWDGRNEEWLIDALNSLPRGTPFAVAQNDGKLEMAAALNDCLAEIETEFVFVMGADDLAGPLMLEKLEAAIGDADGVYPRMEGFGDRTFTFEPPHFGRHIFQYRNTCGVFLVRTSVLKAVGGWRDAVIEDWDLMNRIAKAGHRFERLLDAEYLYRQHASSLTQRIENVAAAENFTTEQQLVEILGDKMTRSHVEAVFVPSGTPGVAYVRGQVPAEHLPGIVSQEIRLDNFGSDTWISMHPAVDARDWLYDPQAPPIQIADVDDAYCSEQLIPDLKLNGMHGVARSWLEGQVAHVEFVSRCDAVFCATPHLADLYSQYNDHVYVLRNAVLEADWRRVRKPEEDGKVRIGWAAGKQHEPDSSLIGEALRRVKRRHPGVEVMVVSSFDPAWDFDYVKLPNTPSLATYRRILASFDISLGPIRNHEMGRAKSDLKWLEASMVGAAFVGSDCKPYATVKHGRTGLLCDTSDEWETAIESLVTDQAYRLKLAAAARKHVLTNRTSQKVSYQYRKALAEVRLRAGVKVAA